MNRKAYYTWLFVIGAIWNWGAAVLFFFLSAQILAFLKMQPLNYPGVMQLAMVLVFALGVGYYWVSKDITINHDLVKVGIIAKILAAFVLIYHYFIGNFHLLLALCGTVDLLFAILFVEFLMTMNKDLVRR
jgi:hypothetical protein